MSLFWLLTETLDNRVTAQLYHVTHNIALSQDLWTISSQINGLSDNFLIFFHGQKDGQFFEVKRYHQDILQEKSLFSEVNSDITVYEVNINY